MTTSSKLLPVHKRFDIAFSRGEGVYLFDNDGKKYLDFGAGIAVNALGHCHPKMVKAITKQAKKLWHVSNIYNGNELNNYAEKLTKAASFDLVFFCNSGAESVECAIKMMRRHFYCKNQPQKNRIITFTGAFHGRTIATISAAAKKKYLEGFEPALPGFDNVEFGNIAAVKNAINENTAGILIEPIQGEEGIKVADKKFILELRKICDEKNLLLTFDEVQCGMGRSGYLFAYEFFGVKPDIVATAKAIAGGFPLGACLATKDAASGMTLGVHGTTYGGNPLAMAVADSVLEVILQKNFLENVRKVGEELKTELQNLKKIFPDFIEEIRGVGLMLGMKINQKIENNELVKKFIANGLLAIPAGENVIRIMPPLIITQEHVMEAIEKMQKVFLDSRLRGNDK
ncbi:MAG: acetylornithine transaminase [Alphaproteobacteria bacterium RIFCSPLOWO2_01_FULL_40_26]|nr:MAG: acetylornithine transaminase [Alphaproteobacteria bacterium RIFCSPHIGHO2_02_FULL_40_34]OFW87981.1 MAG: acetylornithine transaminase [Alphaproteobacteria bacterium RIFCSPHIGHO2_01_FULL_40_8]OFW95332.1 MAG: acetylornithine transaminase [Alphaproteobacteria bacterium RIFCSPLOWO2_01_FULL_40_26]OFX09235.1 MAG: acetylornithine transaminase [Alphaproteobacteria bacterium RIFCSPLOWO2_02_FULL_40_19]OFX11590.1 MAG: acetylornithine transaminase [Alphaproteobacteria bacterium RIFCSPLOWO2_12_FULL_40